MIFTATLFWHHPMSLLTFDIFNMGYQSFFGASRIILFIKVDAISAAFAKDPEGLGVVQVVACYYQLQDQEPFKKHFQKLERDF